MPPFAHEAILIIIIILLLLLLLIVIIIIMFTVVTLLVAQRSASLLDPPKFVNPEIEVNIPRDRWRKSSQEKENGGKENDRHIPILQLKMNVKPFVRRPLQAVTFHYSFASNFFLQEPKNLHHGRFHFFVFPGVNEHIQGRVGQVTARGDQKWKSPVEPFL